MSDKNFNPKYRSQQWFDNPTNPGMTALYLERSMNFGLTPDELRLSRDYLRSWLKEKIRLIEELGDKGNKDVLGWLKLQYKHYTN